MNRKLSLTLSDDIFSVSTECSLDSLVKLKEFGLDPLRVILSTLDKELNILRSKEGNKNYNLGKGKYAVRVRTTNEPIIVRFNKKFNNWNDLTFGGHYEYNELIFK
jgi:DNA-binding transcriptional regulator PaaX